ncbi:hypothetical protein AVEN_74777-1, partial [Araneus ventricosus]
QLPGSLISIFRSLLFVDPVEATIFGLTHLVINSTMTKNPPSIGSLCFIMIFPTP